MISSRQSSLLIAICVIAFSACTKHEPDNGAVTDECNNITEVLEYHPYTEPTMAKVATITYDEKGRVKTVVGEGQNRATYTYYYNRIVLVATDIFGNSINNIYILDGKGRVIRTAAFDHHIIYDAAGYLVSYRQPYGDNTGITGYTTYTLRYENGDLVEVSANEDNIGKKITFGYYDEPNQDLMGYNEPLYISGLLGDRNTFYLIKAGFFGKLNAHLYKSIDENMAHGPWYINYSKDSKGRITNTLYGYGFTYACP